MNTPKMRLVETFSGAGMQRRGIENSKCFDVESVATCETDANAIICYAAIHEGLTPDLVESYTDYPSREDMAKELADMHINYDFVKDKEYDWNKVARSKDSKNQLKNTWLACKLSKNVGDISRVKQFPKCGMLTFSFPCFAAGTKIKTTQGLVNIEDVIPGKHTISMYGKEYQIYNLFNNGIHKIFDMTFDDGYTVTCTYNHPFPVQKGLVTEWVEAINLMNDDKIIKEDGTYASVINKTNNREDEVFDIQVQDVHMFVLENGVCTKNCTDLSVAGKQKGMEAGETRSGLVWEVIRILKNMKDGIEDLEPIGIPNFLLMENVDALVNKKNLPQYEKLNEEFKELGYECVWQVINGKDTGVPQNRRRIFSLYYKENIKDRISSFEFPTPFDTGKRLKDVLEDEVDLKYYVYNSKVVEMLQKLIDNGTLDEQIKQYDELKSS